MWFLAEWVSWRALGSSSPGACNATAPISSGSSRSFRFVTPLSFRERLPESSPGSIPNLITRITAKSQCKFLRIRTRACRIAHITYEKDQAVSQTASGDYHGQRLGLAGNEGRGRHLRGVLCTL